MGELPLYTFSCISRWAGGATSAVPDRRMLLKDRVRTCAQGYLAHNKTPPPAVAECHARACSASEQRANHSKKIRTFRWKSRPESGLDCRMRHIRSTAVCERGPLFARQVDRPKWTTPKEGASAALSV